MSEEKERRAKIISLFTDACTDQRAVHTKKNRITGHKNTTGHGNIVINGDITFGTVPSQQPATITDDQGYEIQQLIYKLAEADITCGYTTSGIFTARHKYWYLLRSYFKVTSYRHILYSRFEEALTYLNHHLDKLQLELGNKDRTTWRNKYYTAIFARCNGRNITKEQLYQMADHYLDASIDSLKQLSDTELKHLYNIIMA